MLQVKPDGTMQRWRKGSRRECGEIPFLERWARGVPSPDPPLNKAANEEQNNKQLDYSFIILEGLRVEDV